MSGHLLAIAVGPVQDFIASARRTRDLWFGSKMLSEVSKAAALGVFASGGELIFPAPENAEEELRPDSELVVVNVVLAHVPDGKQPKDVSKLARERCEERWKDYTDETWRDAHTLIEKSLWDLQIKDVIEFYAAWTPLKSQADYPKARQRVMRLLAGRKACRNFEQSEQKAFGIPKSSLDGQRESVWKTGELDEPSLALKRRLRLTDGEELDAIGLVKRLGGGKQGYPSVSRIAADPWLSDPQKDLTRLMAACEALRGHGLIPLPQTLYGRFPYEGSAVYRTRHKEIPDDPERATTVTAMKELKDALDASINLHREPQCYFAVLAADGDRMGKTLSKIEDLSQHQEFSRELSRFAASAGEIVRRHHGCLVYAGGDDVLAFCPLDQALPCARALHEEFGTILGTLLRGWNWEEEDFPTLSVGLGIGHQMEPLEDLLELGRAAEKAAKQPDRDGLAIHFQPRSGAPLTMRAAWKDGLDERLRLFTQYHLGNLFPDGAAYDLSRMSKIYEAKWDLDASRTAALQADAMRLLSGKRTAAHQAQLRELEQRIKKEAKDAGDLKRIADEIILARRFADAYHQSGRPAWEPTQ